MKCLPKENSKNTWNENPQALPIKKIDWNTLTITAIDGTELREYGCDGTWVPIGALKDGDIRYLGSATHGGHIELKAMFRLIDGKWVNLLTGASCELEETTPIFAR